MTKWRKMNSAPRDGTPILVGRWIKNGESKPEWIQLVVTIKLTDQTILEFDAWTVIPKPPSWGKE